MKNKTSMQALVSDRGVASPQFSDVGIEAVPVEGGKACFAVDMMPSLGGRWAIRKGTSRMRIVDPRPDVHTERQNTTVPCASKISLDVRLKISTTRWYGRQPSSVAPSFDAITVFYWYFHRGLHPERFARPAAKFLPIFSSALAQERVATEKN